MELGATAATAPEELFSVAIASLSEFAASGAGFSSSCLLIERSSVGVGSRAETMRTGTELRSMYGERCNIRVVRSGHNLLRAGVRFSGSLSVDLSISATDSSVSHYSTHIPQSHNAQLLHRLDYTLIPRHMLRAPPPYLSAALCIKAALLTLPRPYYCVRPSPHCSTTASHSSLSLKQYHTAMLALHLLRVIALLSLCSPALSHFVDPTVAAFPILPTASETHTVRLPAPSTTTCTFTYSTAPPTIDSDVPKQRVELADVVATLSKPGDERNPCSTINSNFWDYELCLGGGVTQHKAGDRYTLGRQRVVKETTIVFTEGDQCSASDYTGPRETTVKVACDPAATVLRVTDISEPRTCRYEMTLSTAAVCGDDRFPRQVAGVSNEDRAVEDWFMEVTSLHGHDSHSASSVAGSGSSASHPVDVMCSVYSLEARAKQSELNFQHWEVSINKGSGSSTAEAIVGRSDEEAGESVRQARSELVVVRHPGRRKMYGQEFDVEYGQNSHTVKNSAAFTGQLAFIKLYA